MIKASTKCNDCAHVDVCRYKDHVETDMNRLKNMTYGDGPNDDYDWETMSTSCHVDITFSCPDYRPVVKPSIMNYSYR